MSFFILVIYLLIFIYFVDIHLLNFFVICLLRFVRVHIYIYIHIYIYTHTYSLHSVCTILYMVAPGELSL